MTMAHYAGRRRGDVHGGADAWPGTARGVLREEWLGDRRAAGPAVVEEPLHRRGFWRAGCRSIVAMAARVPTHRDSAPAGRATRTYDQTHCLRRAPPDQRHGVNSIHHQGKRLAPGFVVEAVSHPTASPRLFAAALARAGLHRGHAVAP